jgi:TonB family protein
VTQTPLRKLRWLLLVALASAMCVASDKTPALSPYAPLNARERQLWTLAHSPRLTTTSRFIAPARCEATHPPEALATPNPLLDTAGLSTNVTVSIIIGVDGRVHSPLILDSLGSSEDRIVLNAVRSWRYRPATCNGVPTEAEGRIAFSSR